MICEEYLELEGGIRGRLAYPDGYDAVALAVVAGPHPLLGGERDNPVVTALLEGLAEVGCAALTWRYGAHAVEQRGSREIARLRSAFWEDPSNFITCEEDIVELRACESWLRQARLAPNEAPLLLAGYSYGGALALLAADEGQPVFAVSPPLAGLARQQPRGHGRASLLVAQDDLAVPGGTLCEFLAANPDATARLVPDEDHFFRSSGELLRSSAMEFGRLHSTGVRSGH